jgi:DNA-binding transcriptional LysR family regulator
MCNSRLFSHRSGKDYCDLYTLRRAAICGVGVACLPALLVADDLSGGALLRLLPSLSSQLGVVHAVFPSRRGMAPAVRSLLDSLSEGFAANPWLVRGEHPADLERGRIARRLAARADDPK